MGLVPSAAKQWCITDAQQAANIGAHADTEVQACLVQTHLEIPAWAAQKRTL